MSPPAKGRLGYLEELSSICSLTSGTALISQALATPYPQPPKLCLCTEAAEQPDTESAPGRKLGTEDGPKALLGGPERRGSTPVCIGETAASKPNI